MIKSISITNFQSHKNSFIEFCDGLNVITGSHEDISKAATNPVFVGRIACEKKTLEQMFGHVPEVFIMEIEEGIITDLW